MDAGEERFQAMFERMTLEQIRGARRLLFAGPCIDRHLWKKKSDMLLEMCDIEMHRKIQEEWAAMHRAFEQRTAEL